MNDMLRVGVITSTHGVRGEVKVFPTTDDAARFKTLERVYVDLGHELKPLEIQNVKFFKNMVILKFKDYDNINQVEIYRSKDLLITRDQAVELGENEYFIGDLIGLKVMMENGKELGVIRDVLETGANDVYIVDAPGNREILIPAIEECVKEVDLEAGVMTVHLLEGLLDL
ncbi:MAG TPA: ribosome maturation factor RimM [Candidatus Enterocloster faecavium]|uniref:Ribosome maturation factor RimM n=1 Tax=Candidatus Enterocloster faecavium TaxID=2838560 RepID=A0A9D2RK23_9FIRM|nr:ribosome maturation factor RimM [Candidatus Enterocloster faecavium]